MKLAARLLVAVLCLSFAAGRAATAQVAYNEGQVERVVLLHVNAGHMDATLASLKKDGVPVWEAEKKAGIIIDYRIFFNQTTGSSADWDIGYSIFYANMAALDGIGDKVDPITKAHYGDAAKRQGAAEKRAENSHVVSSMLIREVTLR